MKQIANMQSANLSEEKKTFITKFGREAVKPSSDEIGSPVYLVSEDDKTFAFIEDFVLTDVKGFEKNGGGPGLGLYRGGICVAVNTQWGMIALYDERSSWLKPSAAGTARFSEGNDLLLAASRELTEEIYPVAMVDGKESILAPSGTNSEVITEMEQRFADAYGVTIEARSVKAELIFDHYVLNDTNSSLELMATIDYSSVSLLYVAAIEDEWFRGGRFLPQVVTLASEVIEDVMKISIEGVCVPRQGHFSLDGVGLHPTMVEFF